MGIIGILIVIAIIGLIVWAVTTLIPMPPQFQTIILVVACLLVLLWLLEVFGGAGFNFGHFGRVC